MGEKSRLSLGSQAAYGGHLEVLQWALVEGCPWDRQTDDDDKLGDDEGEEMWKWITSPSCPRFESKQVVHNTLSKRAYAP